MIFYLDNSICIRLHDVKLKLAYVILIILKCPVIIYKTNVIMHYNCI
jgi:hypothetical protein